MSDRTCRVCGASIADRPVWARYCGGACQRRWSRATPRRPKAHPNSSSIWTLACAHCGCVFVTPNPRRRLCSAKCRKQRERAQARATGSRQRGKRRAMDRRMAAGLPAQNNGAPGRQDMARRRRAKLKGVDVEKIDAPGVYERDGWRCQLCGRQVDRRRVYPDRLSASLDHIVPLSLGGDHVAVNVQLAHLCCNVAKSNRAVGEQLLLIG